MKKSPTILIVDDEPFNIDYLEQELEDLAYHTISAKNGQEALVQVANHAPDLVLLDIMMPIMDGFTVLAHLKADNKTRHIPVIVISAMDDINSVARGISLGAEDYLPKPFEPTLLQVRIQTCLEKKQLRDQELDYLEQIEHLTQAALALENQTFFAESLNPVAARTDALGRLARVFQHMAKELYEREQRLLQKIQQVQQDVKEIQQAITETPLVYVPIDRRYALSHKQDMPPHTRGTVLFVDISGFTALTESLAQEMGLKRGAEELMRHLNRTYELLVAQVHRYGGSVINFTGDAITCWFDDLLPIHHPAAAWRATSSAWMMQQNMQSLAPITTPSGSNFSLSIKAVVVSGPVCRFLVGRPDIQRIEVLAGDTISTLAVGERLTMAGETLLHHSVVEALEHRATCNTWKEDTDLGHSFAVLQNLTTTSPPSPWPEIPADALPPEDIRPWLLDVVYQHVQLGQSSDLAELRTVSALFLKFSGILYEQDPQAQQKLDLFLTWVQEVILAYQGHVLQFSTGDKGSYLYATFGAPIACENDAVLAVSAAQSLRIVPAHLSFITSIHIGLARGSMRTGPYGSPLRRTYGAVGDQTNLAARLMVLATNDVLCDASIYQVAKESYSFEKLPAIQVKGRSQPVELFRLVGSTVPALRNVIDLLPPGPHLTLKLASLLGEEFALHPLQAIYPVPTEKNHVEEYIQELLQQGLIQKHPSTPHTYKFHLPVVRNTAYDLLLFAQRRQFHAAFAAWLEAHYADHLQSHLADLAHHWQQAEEWEKAISYMEQAGQQAHQQGTLAQAMEWFTRARELTQRTSLLSAEYPTPVLKE